MRISGEKLTETSPQALQLETNSFPPLVVKTRVNSLTFHVKFFLVVGVLFFIMFFRQPIHLCPNSEITKKTFNDPSQQK